MPCATTKGSVRHGRLDDRPIEFPRVDERPIGYYNAFGYGAGIGYGFTQDVLIKHNLAAGPSLRNPWPLSTCQRGFPMGFTATGSQLTNSSQRPHHRVGASSALS